MSEPPRPPGDGPSGPPPDPTAPPAPSSGQAPGPSYQPPSAPSYPPPGGAPTSGAPPVGDGYDAPPPPPYDAQPPGGYGTPPGGYGTPPGGGYVPPGGYQPGYQASGAGYGNPDDKTFALVSHFGGAAGALICGGVLGFVAPLIAYLAKGQQSPVVRAHAVSALNFQLLWSLLALVALVISFCTFGIPTVIVIIIQVVFGVIAGLKANEGQVYQYPMSVNFLK